MAGCATAHMKLRYDELATKTELGESVFLELRSDLPPTVYVAIGSTIPEEALNGSAINVRPTLDMALRDAGYTVLDTPDDATYIIQLNHRSILEYDLTEEAETGDALGSAIAAGATAAFFTEEVLDVDAGAEVGLVVGLIGFLLDSQAKYVGHTLTTYVRITETIALFDEEPTVRYHDTKVVNGASKMGLDIRESLPAMVKELCGTLTGLLPNRTR